MLFCDAGNSVFSPLTPSKWSLANSKEFKRKPVIRKTLRRYDLMNKEISAE